MLVPVVAGVAVIAVATLRLYAAVTLMSRYRVEEYLATPAARRLYWINAAAPLAIVTLLLVLALFTRLWWVEAPAALFGLLIAVRTIQNIRMRFNGEYVEFYRRHQWR